MTDIAIAIDRLAVEVTISSLEFGAYNDDGEFVRDATSAATIRAAVQPASGRQLMDLPEGIRAEARWLAWSRSEIRIDDVICHAGKNYRVLFVWPRGEGGFHRAAMGLLKP